MQALSYAARQAQLEAASTKLSTFLTAVCCSEVGHSAKSTRVMVGPGGSPIAAAHAAWSNGSTITLSSSSVPACRSPCLHSAADVRLRTSHVWRHCLLSPDCKARTSRPP
ncbi:hypothetical protein Vretifemale_5911 [Volvox reticuliferus]|uniref:Uncharacterized protein n=1 Tax=Volvox reticuliferus TaxID=1737510 RepID=A0A8J4FM11_9CHLO|nr:hypothetical protein Vretifemale_5911 [Volvox reticuliferus]